MLSMGIRDIEEWWLPFNLFATHSGVNLILVIVENVEKMCDWLGFKVYTTSINVDVCNVGLATYIFYNIIIALTLRIAMYSDIGMGCR